VTGPLVVVGDAILDVYLEGSVTRTAPDAPVPVVDVERRWYRPGGAALAAMLAARSGAEVVLVAALGHDEAGSRLIELLAGVVDVRPVVLDGETVCKTRLRVGDVPMLRLDSGDGRAAPVPLRPGAVEAIREAGAVLVADYGRGLAALTEVRDLFTSLVCPLVWDPHPRGSAPVGGCTLVTPNAAEAEALVSTSDEVERGRQLLDRWAARAVAVTVGAQGAVLSEAAPPRTSTVQPRPAVVNTSRPDVCGAGDQFAATATESLRTRPDLRLAVRAAVDQASAYVRSGKAASVSVTAGTSTNRRGPLSDASALGGEAWALAARVRGSGGRLVATGGCFDLLHRGHVQMLQQARALGDALIVCINSDASIRRAKGPGRPVVNQADRARVLRALSAVDDVLIFDSDTPVEVLSRLKPDVWVKGEDYAGAPIPEAGVVERQGGRVVLLPLVRGYSTTRLVRSARHSTPGADEVS
jgi:D-beta-D-heptose 7-phosphate kinase/D-beta-D-heptose 1-phosphate adenosyltransferase